MATDSDEPRVFEYKPLTAEEHLETAVAICKLTVENYGGLNDLESNFQITVGNFMLALHHDLQALVKVLMPDKVGIMEVDR